MGLAPSAVYQLARSAGFTPAQAVTMTAIAGAESGWNPNQIGDVNLEDDTYGPSVGLWQIRSEKAQAGTGRPEDVTRLTDPVFNAYAARQKYLAQGFGAWSTFSNGRFRSYLGATTAPTASGGSSSTGSGGAIVPGATIGKTFGMRGLMWAHTGGIHTGIDLIAKAGTPIYARAGGVVKRADYAVGSYGYHVQVQVDARTLMIYAHMRRPPMVKAGQSITAGQQLGELGHSGNTGGFNHCHFEVRIDGKAIDPAPYVTGGAAMGSSVPSSWDASAVPASLAGDAAGAVASSVWDQVKPALFTLTFVGAGAAIVLVGLGITALPSTSQN